MRISRAVPLCLLTALIGGCAAEKPAEVAQQETPAAPMEVGGSDQRTVEQRLKMFDELDFDVYSNQKWDRFSESHADNIVVNWPDGRQTTGLQPHIEDLKKQFVFAPDTKITEHPIRFGSGEWTCVTGVMTGTFSQPMPLPNGKTAPPTGKKFKLPMATIARWDGGKMVEESLFWDNHEFMRQIGLAQ